PPQEPRFGDRRVVGFSCKRRRRHVRSESGGDAVRCGAPQRLHEPVGTRKRHPDVRGRQQVATPRLQAAAGAGNHSPPEVLVTAHDPLTKMLNVVKDGEKPTKVRK
ncbi:unnamed protein product, partial [Sphacelaria rigidula]